jgi:hypothetical protein
MIDNSGHTKPLFESRGMRATPERWQEEPLQTDEKEKYL